MQARHLPLGGRDVCSVVLGSFIPGDATKARLRWHPFHTSHQLPFRHPRQRVRDVWMMALGWSRAHWPVPAYSTNDLPPLVLLTGGPDYFSLTG